ncbi:MAG: Transcriptional regulator [Pseudomonadota bacterium]|nr:Transcriptional regulator [Pseudomonadota bacterium]
MRSEEHFTVIESEHITGATFDVVRYDSLQGSDDLNVAEKIFFANQAKIYLKMVRVTLQNSELLLEPSALYFMRGHLQLESTTGGGIAKGLMRKFLSGETLFQSRIKGSGDIFLEPSFGHYLLFNIENDGLIFDKRAFYCASGGIEVSAKLQQNISSALFGGEGFFQTQARGSGIVVLVSPVPVTELLVYELAAGETLSVDGNFAFVRTENIRFHAQLSSKSLFSTVVSGELLLQTFTGPGTVWLAPTQGVYDKMKLPYGVSQLSHHAGSAGTNTR